MRKIDLGTLLSVVVVWALVWLAFYSCVAHSAEIEPSSLRSNTVVLADGNGHGSGFLFTRDDTTFIWTAAHVANNWMKDDGTFRLVGVKQGKKVGKAKVLRCGDHKVATDCALLELVEGPFEGDSKFYRAFDHVEVGQRVVHCGSPKNHEWNQRLVVYGRFCAVNCYFDSRLLLKGRYFDQVNLAAFGGCSGGPVCDLETGAVVGMVVIGNRRTPCLEIIEPTRHIYEWARKHDCLWAFDREVSMPGSRPAWIGDMHKRLIERKWRRADDRWGDPVPTPAPEPEKPEPQPAAQQPGIRDLISVLALAA